MTNPLLGVLEQAKDASADECRQAIQLYQARLRELEPTPYYPWVKDAFVLPRPDGEAEYDECQTCGLMRGGHSHDFQEPDASDPGHVAATEEW